MLKSVFVCLFVGILMVPIQGNSGTTYMSNGSVNSSNGTSDRDLKYEDFEITEDGYITGYIVNDSSKAHSGIRLDMWTTNIQETKIFWRKSLNIGDLSPHGKYLVKEPYKVENEDPTRTKFMFRIPSGANFRNN